MPNVIDTVPDEYRTRTGGGGRSSAWEGVADFLVNHYESNPVKLEDAQAIEFVQGDDFDWTPSEGKDTKPGDSARAYLNRVIGERLGDNVAVSVRNSGKHDDRFVAQVGKLSKAEQEKRAQAVAQRQATMEANGTRPGRRAGQ